MGLSNEAADMFPGLKIHLVDQCKVFTAGCVGKLNHNRIKFSLVCVHFVSITMDIKALMHCQTEL